MPKLDRRVLVAGTAMVALLECSSGGHASAQTLSPYSEFQAMSVAQMQALQVKLTLVGERRSAWKTIVGRAVGQTPALGVFTPFYRAAFLPSGYNSDYHVFESFSATTQELKAMIDQVATVSEVTDGGVDTDGYLSFALANIVDGNTKVFESVVSPTTGRLLFGAMLGAFSANDSATTVLERYACGLGMLPSGPPSDVTSQVSIQLRGFRKDRSTGQYVGRARITNTSQQAIAAPVIFVFHPPDNVTTVGGDGVTCAIDPPGSSYVSLPIGGTFAPGQQVDLLLKFDNPDGERIELHFQRVFAGAGFR